MLVNTQSPTPPRLDKLRVDHLKDPLALPVRSPRFSWQIAPGTNRDTTQRSYRIRIHRREPGDAAGPLAADTGEVASPDSVTVRVPGFVGQEGADYTWTLEVWTSDAARLTSGGTFGIGIGIESTSWQAPWVEPEQDTVIAEGPLGLSPQAAEAGKPVLPLRDRLHPPRFLRHGFWLEKRPIRARLRITSQGVHQPFLNGSPVGDEVLAPGYESYHRSISVMTHDVTRMLAKGPNVLGVILGDGWYAGRISFLGRSAQYGDRLRATWQLELTDPDGRTHLILPDEGVLSSRGPIDWSDLFIGERYDANAEIPGWDTTDFDDTDRTLWKPSRTVPVTVPLTPFVGEPIRRVAELPARHVTSNSVGETIVDFGQVLAGRVRMRVRGEAGTTVRLEHTETLDSAGSFVNNIHGVNKDQVDEYVLAGRPDGETWEPLFTFHGFRYVRLSGYPGTPRPEDFTAVVISSDLEPTAAFTSSDHRLDRLFANTVWSQRANFLAVPTDCPQRERAGWTGDLQIFAPTAATLMDVASFLGRWLGNVRTDQRDHGGIVPNIVPEPPALAVLEDDGSEFAQITAAAGWGDVITVAPWELYRHYGDIRFLAENFQAMRDWVNFQTRDAAALQPERLRGVHLSGEQAARHELLWNGRLHFGDWLAPSTLAGYLENPADAVMIAPRLTSELVGPMFQARSLDLLASTADILGEHAIAHRSRDQAAAVRDAFASEYISPDGRISPALQGVYVLALAFDMVPASLVPAATDRLVELVHAADDHLDTGFLSVPYLLDVLWENGHPELARTLLLQDTPPSWLYEVKMGATTIWETWRAIHEDGSVEMASMNHYAFGCVVDWMMRRLAGIQLIEPGYRAAAIAPDLDGFLDRCEAHVDTPYGRLATHWERHRHGAVLTITVPVGGRARVVLPPGWALPSGRDDLASGTHVLEIARSHGPDTRSVPA
ncbi:family 78 glycoside hydrolase catalytic domain [Microbacterium sp. B2969]|uniref:alpha-L-rhamnosidase n=1 Tax=Microbacterium alkaliflavum TaxID=3248839 RepID=A0ABW7QDE4_9MICO